jgi:hypothetical protein
MTAKKELKNLTPAVDDVIDPAIPLNIWIDHREGNYFRQNGRIGFWQKKTVKGGDSYEVMAFLTINFDCFIIQELLLDDGQNQDVFFDIATKNTKFGLLKTVKVPATQFQSLSWLIRHHGAQAIFESDQATARKLATGIVMLSGDIPRVVVYTHTGWRLIKDQWQYLTSSGAIGADGLDESIRVDLGTGGNMAKYTLPAPGKNPANVDALLSFLTMAPNNKAIGVVTFCSIIRAVLGECLPIDFSIILVGKTGCFKSETAGLAIGCFGEFTGKGFPANFEDSAGSLGFKAHQAKDLILVVDDFKAGSSIQQTNEINAKFDFIARGAGNQAGRDRLHNSSTFTMGAHVPNCLPWITAEMTPSGGSGLARSLVMEMKEGDISDAMMTDLQHSRNKGETRAVMANFCQWLAPRLDGLKKTYPAMVERLRTEANSNRRQNDETHRRTVDIYAQLVAAAEVFIEFAHDVGAINSPHSERLSAEISEALSSAMKAQDQYRTANDEVDRFVSLLRGCFFSGECYVVSHTNQGPPLIHPHTWGWRAVSEGGDLAGRGQLIGWINEAAAEIWLEPEALFKTVQKFAAAQNDPILINKTTLFKRILERGLLASFETEKNGIKRPAVHQSVGGRRPRVLKFSIELITETKNKPAEPEQYREFNDE